jgi:hypothetical protein
VRPPHPDQAPAPGYQWAAVPDLAWAPDTTRRCRAGAAPHHPACGRTSAARLWRKAKRAGRPSWWHYCAEHMYGRWVEDGIVLHWVQRPVETPEPVRPGTNQGGRA